VGYFRSDSLRTISDVRRIVQDKEYLLYDFSMEIGDTAYVGFELWSSWQPADTAGFKLMSVDTITQFGVSRRRFNMLFEFPGFGPNEFYWPMAWIEGIGSDQILSSLSCVFSMDVSHRTAPFVMTVLERSCISIPTTSVCDTTGWVLKKWSAV
jgi:hypothetical protein